MSIIDSCWLHKVLALLRVSGLINEKPGEHVLSPMSGRAKISAGKGIAEPGWLRHGNRRDGGPPREQKQHGAAGPLQAVREELLISICLKKENVLLFVIVTFNKQGRIFADKSFNRKHEIDGKLISPVYKGFDV